MKQDAFCPCVGSCPYDILTQYMNKCPQKSNDIDSTELSFLRAVTARGERTLTEFKLGEGEAKKCFERVNSKLPENLQLDKVGKKVGRYTAASICMNNKVDSVTTSMATKHKCMESLKGKTYLGYIVPDSSLLMAAGLGIAKAISSKKKSKHFAGEVMDDDTATEDENDDAKELDHTENIRASNTGFKHSNQLSSDEKKTGLSFAKTFGSCKLLSVNIIKHSMNYLFCQPYSNPIGLISYLCKI